MRRWIVLPVVFACALALVVNIDVPRAAAKQKDAGGVAEQVTTADGFLLSGMFHKSEKQADTSPVVILLYPPGKDNDMTKGEWGGLTKQLNKEGFHVFRFDWRGHGKSKEIANPEKFWNLDRSNPWTGPTNTASIKNAPPKKPIKEDFVYGDFKDARSAANYLPVYVNDLAAVRLHLDKKNDNSKVNTSSIYLIGAGDAASIGMAWINAEWNRPATAPSQLELGAQSYQFVPQIPGRFVKSPAGADIAGAVWLSPTISPRVPKLAMQDWVQKAPTRLRTTPMMFLVADKDTASKRDADVLFKEVLVARPPKNSTLNDLDKTFPPIELKGADQLKGVQLLGKNAEFKTEDLIVQYLVEKLQKKRPVGEPSKRDYKEAYYVDLRAFGITP